MKKLTALFIIAISIAFASCGEKVKELKEAGEAVQNLAEAAKTMEKSQEAVNAKLEDRKKRGDTLAMDYKKLQEFLPKSIDGYTAGQPEGSAMNMQGASFSQAKIEFKKGNDVIEIELTDYNATIGLYQAAAAIFSMNITNDNKEYLEKTFDPQVPGAFAFEKFYKIDKRAELTYAVGYRFILSMHANNQTSTDFLKKVAQSMKLADLAKM